MFDFAWSELALIGVVALVAIGPKDLPVAIKTIAQLVKKARRMAGEFQTHVDEMVREANLHDVRDQFNDLRRMDIKGKILSAVDGDGSIRKTMADTQADFSPPPPVIPVHDAAPDPLPEVAVAEQVPHVIAPPVQAPAFVPPAFVPTEYVPPANVLADPVLGELQPPSFVPPAFVPPEAAPPNSLAPAEVAATQPQHA